MTPYAKLTSVDEYYLLEDSKGFAQGEMITIYSGGGCEISGGRVSVIRLAYYKINSSILRDEDFLKNVKLGTFEDLRQHKLNSLID
jgi:hypothetical protein